MLEHMLLETHHRSAYLRAFVTRIGLLADRGDLTETVSATVYSKRFTCFKRFLTLCALIR